MRKIIYVIMLIMFCYVTNTGTTIHAEMLEYTIASTVERFDTETGVLTISGTGVCRPQKYEEFIYTEQYEFPWEDYLVKEVIIEEGITSIGRDAFSENHYITKCTLPNELIEIGDKAFENTAIEEIIIPSSVSYIGYSAFGGCKKLERIVIEGQINYALHITDTKYYNTAENWENGILYLNNSVIACDENYITDKPEVTFRRGTTYINPGCLKNSTVRKIVFPDGVQTIGGSVGAYCNDLVSVYIPDSVTVIESNVFNSCPNLEISCNKGSYAEKYAKVSGIFCDASTYVIGDINKDKILNAEDALMVLKHAARLMEINKSFLADVNYDGNIDAEDAIYILKCASRLI